LDRGGKRNREIAELLGCSMRTVEKHVENIMEALNGETRSGLAAWWHERRRAIERQRERNGSQQSDPDEQSGS
jgi:DNA-binding NarL/FixJ family response regulator